MTIPLLPEWERHNTLVPSKKNGKNVVRVLCWDFVSVPVSAAARATIFLHLETNSLVNSKRTLVNATTSSWKDTVNVLVTAAQTVALHLLTPDALRVKHGSLALMGARLTGVLQIGNSVLTDVVVWKLLSLIVMTAATHLVRLVLVPESD